MLLEIEDKSLLEISNLYCKSLQKDLLKIIRKNNLTDKMEGFFKSETNLHIHRVSDFACFIATKLSLNNNLIETIAKVAPLHDFGKLKIDYHILTKPGKLTFEEFEVIKTHPQIGFDLLSESGNKTLDLAALVALEHHEKWNRKGYPNGLSGCNIHLISRIVAAADVLDSLISDRCYKKGWEKEKVRKIFKEQRGEQFDPVITDIVLDNFDWFFEGCGV